MVYKYNIIFIINIIFSDQVFVRTLLHGGIYDPYNLFFNINLTNYPVISEIINKNRAIICYV